MLLEGVFLATCVFGTVLEARYCIKSPISLARPYTLREVGTEVPRTQIRSSSDRRPHKTWNTVFAIKVEVPAQEIVLAQFRSAPMVGKAVPIEF